MDMNFYTTKQISDLFGVTIRTVQMWADRGIISVNRTDGGHRRIAESEIAKIRDYLGLKTNPTEISDSNTVEKPGLQILLVEDDEYMLSLYEEAIKSWDHPATSVVTANDGYQALIEIGKHDFDLIVADIMMPNIDGAKMIDIIRRNQGDSAPTIAVVTSLEKDELYQQYAIPKDIAVFEKPVSFAQLHRLALSLSNSPDELPD